MSSALLKINQKHPSWQLARLPLATPTEVLINYDPDILDGGVMPYPWQVKHHQAWARDLRDKNDIIKLATVAANGSGKSQFIIAPENYWLAACFADALVVITTSSHNQMDTQTERYLARLCNTANKIHYKELGKQNLWHIVKRRIGNQLTGACIDLFVTDEPGKAEGRHPLSASARFSVTTDESKTIDDNIFGALARCHGQSHRLEVSSPGLPRGHFYKAVTDPKLGYEVETVTVHDCPHIKLADQEAMIAEFGINSPIVQSSLYAKFMPDASDVVITSQLFDENNRAWEDVSYAKASLIEFVGSKLRAGLDLSRGGDESVLSVWKGNEEIALYTFRQKDAEWTAQHCVELLKNHPGLTDIRADDGGVGAAIVDRLAHLGYPCKRIHNQASAIRKKHYFNRGAELYFNLKRWLEVKLVKFLPDEDRAYQLTNRNYSFGGQDPRPRLQSKPEAKAQGFRSPNGSQSPDRADATALAWAFEFYPDEINKLDERKAQEKPEEGQGLSEAQLYAYFDNKKFGDFKEEPQKVGPRFFESQVLNSRKNKKPWQRKTKRRVR